MRKKKLDLELSEAHNSDEATNAIFIGLKFFFPKIMLHIKHNWKWWILILGGLGTGGTYLNHKSNMEDDARAREKRSHYEQPKDQGNIRNDAHRKQ